jgi:hypothetical protein
MLKVRPVYGRAPFFLSHATWLDYLLSSESAAPLHQHFRNFHLLFAESGFKGLHDGRIEIRA